MLRIITIGSGRSTAMYFFPQDWTNEDAEHTVRLRGLADADDSVSVEEVDADFAIILPAIE